MLISNIKYLFILYPALEEQVKFEQVRLVADVKDTDSRHWSPRFGVSAAGAAGEFCSCCL